MASELTINYNLSYKISVDVEKGRTGDLNWLWEEAEDEEQFIEFLTDIIIADLELFEAMKLRGDKLPDWLTHFSLSEHLDTGNDDAQNQD